MKPKNVSWFGVTVEQGKHTGARAGRVLYGPGRAATP